MTKMKRVKIHDGKDISNLKIYHDIDTGIYKHQTHCRVCGVHLMCMCYTDIESAINAHKRVMCLCDRHLLAAKWHHDDLGETIDTVAGTNIAEKTREMKAIQSGDLMSEETLENITTRENQLIEECVGIIQRLSGEQIEAILSESEMDFDDDMYGETCDV